MSQIPLFTETELTLQPGNYAVVLHSNGNKEPELVSVSEDTAISFIEIKSAQLPEGSRDYYSYMPMLQLRNYLERKEEEKC